MNQKIKNKKIIQAILLGIFTYTYFQIMYIVSQQMKIDSHIEKEQNIQNIHSVRSPTRRLLLSGNWKVITGNSFNIDNLNTYLTRAELKEIRGLDSIADWYRGELIWFLYQYVEADSILLQKPLYLSVKQIGASEIYLNNKKIIEIGKPSDNIQTEECINYSNPILLYIDKPFTILIKHSELNPMLLKRQINYDYSSGIHLIFSREEPTNTNPPLSFIIGFLITLFFIHLLMYFFYPEIKDNLFFAVFLLCFTSTWICFSFSNSANFTINLIGHILMDTSISASFISLIWFIQKVFHQHLSKLLWGIFLLIFLLSCISIFIDNDILEKLKIIGTVWLIIFTVIYIFITIWQTSKKQIPGIKIIQAGIFCFGFAIFVIISILFYAIVNKTLSPDFNGSIKIQSNSFISLLFLFLFLALFSIPISMSIYLAHRFAHTNIQLKNKLTEVENLNKEILQKEKEKHEILINQNKILEQQVKERTREILQQKDLLQQKNRDILDSINYASRIQKALLTSCDYIQKHFINENFFSEYFLLYLPKDIVSGDFYWANINSLHPQKPHYIAVCDCTGHGVPGAFMSLLNINYLNEAIQEKQLYYPNEILNYVRQKLITNLSYDEQQKDGMDASLMLFDNTFLNNRKAYYTLANHPIIYIKSNGTVQILTGDKMPVGKGHFENDFKVFTIELEKGDWIYLYTDGYKDQFGGDKGKRMMHKKFIEIISEIHTRPANEQKEYLHQFFIQWKQNQEQTDDVCILGIKI